MSGKTSHAASAFHCPRTTGAALTDATLSKNFVSHRIPEEFSPQNPQRRSPILLLIRRRQPAANVIRRNRRWPLVKSFPSVVVELLERNGPCEATALAEQAARTVGLRDARSRSEGDLLARVLQIAEKREHGVWLQEEPHYCLRRPLPDQPPSSLRLRAVYEVLSTRREASLSELVQAYGRRYREAASRPLFQMYWHLRNIGDRSMIHETGRFMISPAKVVMAPRLPSSDRPTGLLASLKESALEELLAANPGMIEPGLVLVRRQAKTGCVGTIDLLCKDRNHRYVVVELKRPKARDREVVAQIAAYMGWVQENLASGQPVRGIIIVGQATPVIRYSVMAAPGIEVISW